MSSEAGYCWGATPGVVVMAFTYIIKMVNKVLRC